MCSYAILSISASHMGPDREGLQRALPCAFSRTCTCNRVFPSSKDPPSTRSVSQKSFIHLFAPKQNKQ